MKAEGPTAVLDYQFRQKFRVPSDAAYSWATDYTSEDWRIAGLVGRREVRRLGTRLVRLRDTMPDEERRPVTKTRLVELYPAEHAWVSTHVGGPCLHSQFRYRIRSAGRDRSELQFSGRELRWDRPYSVVERRRLEQSLRRADAALWREFARAMEAEWRSGATGHGTSPNRRYGSR